MGGSYDSIHARTDDRCPVFAALEEFAQTGKWSFYVSPPVRDWISVFPSPIFEESDVAIRLSERLTSDVFRFGEFDEDIFWYEYYNAGQLVDEFSSRPDYERDPEDVPKAEWERLRGRPERYRHLLSGEQDLERLRDILDASKHEDHVWPSQQMEDFATVLGISYARWSYDYLAEEADATSVERWDEFVHIERRISPGKRRARKKTTPRPTISAEALALLEQGPPPSSYAGLPICSPAPDGVFVAWQFSGESVPLLRYRRPWERPEDTGVRLKLSVDAIAASPSGRYLATHSLYEADTAELWDLEKREKLTEIEAVDHVWEFAFSADESLLFTRDSRRITVTSIKTLGHAGDITGLSLGGALGVHPSGSFVATSDGHRLILVSWPEQRVVKRALKPRPRGGVVGSLLEAAASLVSTAMARLEGGPAPRPGAGLGVSGLGFTRDGAHLIAKTQGGMHVLAWPDVWESSDGMAEPNASFTADSLYLMSVGRVVVDDGTDHSRPPSVIFHERRGRVRLGDLQTGRARTLLTVPDDPTIMDLMLTGDGTALCLVCMKPLESHGAPLGESPHLRIWDYPDPRACVTIRAPAP